MKELFNLLRYTVVGILFGIVFVKAEIISWFRIQEMFRFESFHMYGVIGSAVVVGIVSMQLLKRSGVRALSGEEIYVPPKQFNWGMVYGGLLFGLGWGITGACPGPLYAQIGAGYPAVLVTLFFAVVGTWLYGWLKPRLPH